MADKKNIKQYRGSSIPTELEIKQNTQIGINILEKDFMCNNFNFEIDYYKTAQNERIFDGSTIIEIGKTFIYEPGDYLEIAVLKFPNIIPNGVTLDIIEKE